MAFGHTITWIPDADTWYNLVGGCRKCPERAIFSCSFHALRTNGGRQRRITYSSELCDAHGRAFAERHELAIPEPPPLKVAAVVDTVVDMGRVKGSRGKSDKLVRVDRSIGPGKIKPIRFKIPEVRALEQEAKAAGIDFSSYVRYLLETHPKRR